MSGGRRRRRWGLGLTLVVVAACEDPPPVVHGGGGSGGLLPVCEGGGWSVPGGDSFGDDGAEDTTFGMGDDMPLPMTVFAVQQGMASSGAQVELTDVVVTTPAAAGEALTGTELFVQERQGGPYSGLRVHSGVFNLGAVLTVGQTANIIGEVAWHEGYYILKVASASDVTITGTAPLPEPVVVPVAELVPEDPSSRPYEGVPVRVEMATVTDDDPCDGEFILEDTVRVDDRFMPEGLSMPEAGEVLGAVVGVLVYANDSYELAPPDPSAIE